MSDVIPPPDGNREVGCAEMTGYVVQPAKRQYHCGWCLGTGMVETEELWKCSMCEGTGIREMAPHPHSDKDQSTASTK